MSFHQHSQAPDLLSAGMDILGALLRASGLHRAHWLLPRMQSPGKATLGSKSKVGCFLIVESEAQCSDSCASGLQFFDRHREIEFGSARIGHGM